MRALVTFGSSRGGTEGLAKMVADDLRDEGWEADMLPPRQVGELSDYDLVIVGGALYAFRWHRAARRFVRRHKTELRQHPTYFFSSGPLDDSARQKDIPPVKGVKKLMDQTGARGHVTFGGMLPPDAKGYPASVIARKSAGDWRDPERVRDWTASIAAEVQP